MPNKLYKILAFLGMAFVIVAIPLFWLIYTTPKNLEADFLDVGQGDSVLFQLPPGQNILIDGGPDGSVIRELNKTLPWWDKTIDLLILTHPHDDHVSGLNQVLNRYKVNRILYTGITHTSPSYLSWLSSVKDKKIPITIIDKPQRINFSDDAYLDIIYPFQSLAGDNNIDLNDSSIVSFLVYKNTKFLLTGDISEKIEKELLSKNIGLSAEVLKVAHHGSSYSSSEEFLNAVKPKIAVIEVGKDNKFGHPNERIIKRMERLTVNILTTMNKGTIQLVSNGENVSIK
jgi:competence protein ComEC